MSKDMLASAGKEGCEVESVRHLWQPVETAPRDGSKILVYTVHGDIEISEWFETEFPRFEGVEGTDLYRKRIEKVHEGWNSNSFEWWMPLPLPPIEATEPPEANKKEVDLTEEGI